METLDKEMSHILGQRRANGARFHRAPQNKERFQTYCFISEISRLIFSAHSWPWVTETVDREIAGEGEVGGDYCVRFDIQCSRRQQKARCVFENWYKNE